MKNRLIILSLSFLANISLFAQTNTFPNNGNVGIGTDSPNGKLDLNGDLLVKSSITNTSVRPILSSRSISGEIRAYSNNGILSDDGLLRLSAGGGTNSYVVSYIDLAGYSTLPEMDRNIVLGTDGQERLRILSGGNVGIGTPSPQEKLAVNGNIRAKEVKVEAFNWPDYVFKSDYKQLTLSEVEHYIKANGHLPEVPSAKQVEQSGIELGEMNKILLKKIEELTLVLIDKDKEITQQAQRLKIVEKEQASIRLLLNSLISAP